jgi:enoyl-CoA hydratase/carnithine racemase
MSELVLEERPGAGVALLRLNRPGARNALNTPLREALAAKFRALEQDSETRVIVLTGDDQAFAAGADLRELQALDAVGALYRRAHELARPIFDCRKPVIAAVRGFALGGGLETALMCDIMIVGENAKLGLPEVRVGVMPGSGGMQRLVRLVGKHRAMLVALTGRQFTGIEAAAWGVASLCVPDAEVVPTALDTARKLAELPPIGVQLIKEAILTGQDQSLDAALAFDRRSFQFLFATEDRKEGIAAFFEKRKAEFKGR